MTSKETDPRFVGWANRHLARRSSGQIAVITAIACLVATVIVAVSGFVLLRTLGNPDADFALQFAGTPDRLADRIEMLEARGEGFTVDEARATQLYGMAFAVVWGSIGFALFAIFWRHSWNAGLAARPSVVRGIRYLPLAGGTIALVERVVTIASIREGADGAVEMPAGLPAAVVALAWGKWVLGIITIVAVFGMIMSAFARAAQTPLPSAWTAQFREHLDEGMDWRAAQHEADTAMRQGAFSAVAASSDGVAPAHHVGDLRQIGLVDLAPDGIEADVEAVRSATSSVSDSAEPPALALADELIERLEEAGIAGLDPPEGTGVCCSGGGIRAASFALGGLSALERRPDPDDLPGSVLGRAKYLASVSGGGYAASAWRMAAGRGQLPDVPLIGDPTAFTTSIDRYPRPDGGSVDLLTHVRERRVFLANGRGGLPRAVLRALAQTAFHLSLILATVYVVAWPFGKLLGSWAVGALEVDGEGLRTKVGRHQWLPPLVTLIPLVPMALARLLMLRTRARAALDGAMAAIVALAAGSAFVLLAVPYLVEFVADAAPDLGDRVAITGVWAVIVTAVWQATRRYVQRNLQFLGGVFLGLGLIVFAAFIVDASLVDQNPFGRTPLFVGAFIFLFVGFVTFNPDLWSLHDFYRQRLTGTFATKWRDERLWSDPAPPPMHEYRSADGPRPIICCAAARAMQTDTGIAALSMTFEPEAVTVFEWIRPEGSQLAELQAAQMSHEDFTRMLPRGGERLASLMGAAAISGAAVAPSMGRMNMSTTNALLAAFNARLGVWVPSPVFGGQHHLDRRVSPRLVNMFKEIFGVYDLGDPNVYATDGGHWENLGLVELIRRRCARIIAIDTSGDAPGTYATLKEAIELARHECGATVEFGDAWSRLEVDDDGVVASNHMRGTVTYRDGMQADLLYVKAVVARDSSLSILRYAAGDRTFPNYSTGNQMLTDNQLTFLVRLGDEAMRSALDANPDFVDQAVGTASADA